MLNYSLNPAINSLFMHQAYSALDQNMLIMLQLQTQQRRQLEKNYLEVLLRNNSSLSDFHAPKNMLQSYKQSLCLSNQPPVVFRESPIWGEGSEHHEPLKVGFSNLPINSGEIELKNITRKVSPLKTQILHLLNCILKNYTKISKEELLQLRSQYAHSPLLQTIFDLVVQKYSSSSKCREDMVRFVFRKAITFLRDSLREKDKLTAKAASVALCQRYFNLNSEELAQQIDTQDEDQILAFLLPYKKNSRNKTANSSFITEMFTSEIFHQDYLAYLESLDHILNDDNQKKIEKFVDFLESCATHNTLHKIKNYKRIPWLEAWFDSTKSIARELLTTTFLKKGAKKIKTDN